jgi:hypothetical protein
MSTLSGSSSDGQAGTSASQPPSTVRVLSPELSAALTMLKVDVPELYLDSKDWKVSLAVITVELLSGPLTRKSSKGKMRRSL